jgi:hypothetical protein
MGSKPEWLHAVAHGRTHCHDSSANSVAEFVKIDPHSRSSLLSIVFTNPLKITRLGRQFCARLLTAVGKLAEPSRFQKNGGHPKSEQCRPAIRSPLCDPDE